MTYEFKLPSLGEGVTGKVLEILVKPGDKVSKEQIVLVVGTDKVDAEMPIDADGIIEEILVKQGDEVTDGTPILRMKTEGAAPAASTETPAAPALPVPAPTAAVPAPAPEPVAAQTGSKEGLRASPLARKRAKELGATAVIAIDIDYTNISTAADGDLLVVAASGTAVLL